MNDASAEGGFLVLYPEQPRDANPQRCWNWFGAKEQHGGGEVAFVADLTRRIVESEHVDPRGVYVAGLSAGGALAATVAADNPALFAAVAVHSGLPPGAAGNLPDALLAMRNGARRKTASTVPTIVFHGDDDHTVHPGNGTAVIDSVLEGAPTATAAPPSNDAKAARTVYAEPSGDVVAEHWALHGAGHAWAGGAASGSHTDPAGIDATREIVRFFGDHRG
jgi:poly(hydroxyalkanoate) depolymerase family esterase